MSPYLKIKEKQKGFILNGNLTLFAFVTVFFPRILSALKIPSVINFLHFVVIPIACVSSLSTARAKNPNQINASKQLIIGIYFLLIVCITSALLNNAGIINIFLSFILLAEPFIFLLMIISVPLVKERFNNFRLWFFRFAFVNIFFSYIQKYVFHVDALAGGADNVKGVFLAQGAGHVLGGSVSITFGIYYFVSVKTKPLWLRIVLMLVIFNQIVISDTKQVLLSFIVGYGLLYVINFKNPIQSVIYLMAGSIFLVIFYWAIYNIPALGAFTTWIRPEIYGPDGEATRLKLAAFRIVPQYFHSWFNWYLGLGPGHTVGRLGGWMFDTYWNLLEPLGATKSKASLDVWDAVSRSWLGNQSSMFSPLFGWAGIWGDLGILGIFSYFYLAFIVWKYIASDNLSRYFLLTIFGFGCIFSQLEEPGYMLFVFGLIGLRWHEKQNEFSTIQ